MKKTVGHHIVIKPEIQSLKKGQLLLGDDSKMRYKKATVFSCTEGVVEGGDVIFYDSANSHEVVIDSEKYLIIKSDAVAIIL